MPKDARSRHINFIIAVTLRPDAGMQQAPLLYAVKTRSVEEAVEAARALSASSATIEVAGRLSSLITKAMKLKPNEVRSL